MGIGLPVAWSFAGALAYLTYVCDANLNRLMLRRFRSLDSLALVPLPLFILTGYPMQSGGTAQCIVLFVERLATGRKGVWTVITIPNVQNGSCTNSFCGSYPIACIAYHSGTKDRCRLAL